MAKVFFIDRPPYKTTRHWLDYLKENHEVIVDMYFNPVYAEWADVIYIEWAEGWAIEASKGKGHFEDVYDHAGVKGEAHKQYSGNFNWQGKPIFVRAIDIEAYFGHFRQINWDNITGLIYIAKHIYDIMERDLPSTLPLTHVPLSIKLDEWRFKRRNGKEYKIAWVNENWSAKGMPLMLQALHKLISVTGNDKWQLHMVENKRSGEGWLFGYIDHMIKELKLENNVVKYQTVPSVDEFLEDMDYAVSSSHKEAFSLFTAEALAKGIKTLTHNWLGAKDIWPEEIVWTTIDDFVYKMMSGVYDPDHYRDIASIHTHDKEIESLKKITGL